MIFREKCSPRQKKTSDPIRLYDPWFSHLMDLSPTTLFPLCQSPEDSLSIPLVVPYRKNPEPGPRR